MYLRVYNFAKFYVVKSLWAQIIMVKCQYKTCMGKLIMHPHHIFIIIMKQYDEIHDMCLNTLIITRMLVFYNVR